MRRFAPQLFAQLFCIPLIHFFASGSKAQFSSRPKSQEQVQNREWALGSLRRDIPNQYQREKLLAQGATKNDFRNLQIVNNELMKRMFVRSANNTQQITDKEIRDSLGEIKKLAKRLRINLAIPEVQSDTNKTKVSLSPGLLLLDKAVKSFVDNPLFQQPKIFDPDLASRAGKDMSEILRLRDYLRSLTKEMSNSVSLSQ